MQNDDFEYGFGSAALASLEPEPGKPDQLKRKVPANRKQAKQQLSGDENNEAAKVRLKSNTWPFVSVKLTNIFFTNTSTKNYILAFILLI